MFKNINKVNKQEDTLYSNILLLSRNKIFFTEFNLADTFENRIYLIFMHISFLFIKIKQSKEKETYKVFFQKMFDLIFKKIEQNMTEIGYGDTTINRNMKFIVKNFYNILLNCENFKKATLKREKFFFLEYLKCNKMMNNTNNLPLIKYFIKYQAFCLDLSLDSVLKGDLNFKYK